MIGIIYSIILLIHATHGGNFEKILIILEHGISLPFNIFYYYPTRNLLKLLAN